MMGALDSCPGCGLPGGRNTCQDLFNDVSLRVRALAWTDSLKTWRLMHDVYALQHPEELCRTYKDLIAHLGGVAWTLEHDGSERGHRALLQLASRGSWQHEPYPPAPGFPEQRGAVVVSSLERLAEPSLLVAGIDRWARATWVAYAPLQPLAREWVQQAVLLAPERKH
jgi:hypothetical protein